MKNFNYIQQTTKYSSPNRYLKKKKDGHLIY
jgi:hypothetical protein